MQELRELLRVGRRDRAAAPAFLDDLEKTLNRHRRADQALIKDTRRAAPAPLPPRVADIEDDFSDGDFTRNPEWKLVRGEFFIARGSRLFSFVQPQSSSQPKTDAEAIGEIFGVLLGGNRQNQQRQQDRGSAEPAAIFLPGEITNAFEITTRLMSDERTGGVLELGVYQGNQGKNGYRVQFTDEGVARLIRVGRSTVELRDAKFLYPALQNGRPGTYDVRWTRDRNGRMSVHLNGTLIMAANDNGFRDNFDGFRLVNAEGRHAMDAIRISMSN